MGFIFPLLVLGLTYLLLVRPQQQRVRRHRELLALLEVGDEVVTAGGIVARVITLTDERVVVRVSTGVELELLRGAISQRLLPPDLDNGLDGEEQ